MVYMYKKYTNGTKNKDKIKEDDLFIIAFLIVVYVISDLVQEKYGRTEVKTKTMFCHFHNI